MEDNDYEKKKKKHDEKSLLKALLSKLSDRLKSYTFEFQIKRYVVLRLFS